METRADSIRSMLRGNLRRGLALVRRRTPRGPALHVRFYEKPGCGLCGEAYRALTRVRMEMPLDIERIDIEGDAALFERYAIRIPVMAVGADELDAAGLEEPALRRWLAERA
jgi:hypothetical protein